METPDFWPDIRRFLIGFALGGVIIGAYTLMNVQPIPSPVSLPAGAGDS